MIVRRHHLRPVNLFKMALSTLIELLKRFVHVKVSLNLFPVSFRARDNPGYISFFVYLNEISRKLSRKIASSLRKPRLKISISSQT